MLDGKGPWSWVCVSLDRSPWKPAVLAYGLSVTSLSWHPNLSKSSKMEVPPSWIGRTLRTHTALSIKCPVIRWPPWMQ